MSRARRVLIAVTAASLLAGACGADSYWVRSDDPAPTKTLNTRSKSPAASQPPVGENLNACSKR